MSRRVNDLRRYRGQGRCWSFDPGCTDSVSDLAGNLTAIAGQLASCCLSPLIGFAPVPPRRQARWDAFDCGENEFDEGCCDPFAGDPNGCCDKGCDQCCGCDQCGGCGACSCSSCRAGDCWPCWMPRRIHPVQAVVGPGSVLRVRVQIVNRTLTPREFFVAATGPGAALAKGDPSTVKVEAMGCAELVAAVHVPVAHHVHDRPISILLWVRGCYDYAIPVCLDVREDGCGATVIRRVVEQTDDCHTWRDHFYVSRPCAGSHQR